MLKSLSGVSRTSYSQKNVHDFFPSTVVNHSSQNLVRVRERCAREISFVTVAAGTSPYLGLNGALRSRGGGEVQIEKAKGTGFCTSDTDGTFWTI